MSNKPKFVATLSRVKEVSLLGSANLQFWSDQLKTSTIVPLDFDGQARILITASDAKFMGMRMQEFSVCVQVTSPNPDIWPDAAYLVVAYNSRPFFAWFERTMYLTPYHCGEIAVSASEAPSIELRIGGERAFCVSMQQAVLSDSIREPSRTGEERWTGPVFLPAQRPSQKIGGKFFFAQIRGDTQRYPFITSADKLQIRESALVDVFRSLIDSSFTPVEWIVRDNAAHAKSLSYSTSLQSLALLGKEPIV